MVYIFLANGFEEIEAIAPLDILRRAGIEVNLVAIEGLKAKGSHGIEITCDTKIDDISYNNLDMIILPGGMPGTLNLKKNAKVLKAIDYCVNNDKYIGAICAAPSILGAFGYLKGKNATCFPGFEEELKGANFVDAKVVKDGIFITSKGAGTALDFGYFLLSLFDKNASARLREDMQCE